MTQARIKVVTDSTCDLSKDELEALGLTMVPLSVSFGSEVFYDGQLSKDEYWEKTRGPFWPQTSQPPAGAFQEAFARQVDAGHEVVCVTLLSHYSGTYNTACAVARTFGDRVSVVDSGTVSMGLAWQATAAAEAAAAGAGREDIVRLIKDMSHRTRFFAALDTVENVRKGGRLAKLMPLMGRMMRVFDVRLVLVMARGELSLVGAARSYEGAVSRARDEAVALAPLEKIAVFHTRAPERATLLADTLAEMTRVDRDGIRVVEGGPVLACHAGPKVMGVFVLSQSPPAHEAGWMARRAGDPGW
jgi:DegV family protein with EDD domain